MPTLNRQGAVTLVQAKREYLPQTVYSQTQDWPINARTTRSGLHDSICSGKAKMNTFFQVTVFGIPQPQGSTRAFVIKGTNRAVVTSANKKNKPWRQEVANGALCAIETYGFVPLMDGEAVEVDVDFYFDKPKSTKKAVIHKTTKPDVDKLLRSTFDALTGVAFKDDSQIVRCVATKRFGTPARVVIRVGKPMFDQGVNLPQEETCKQEGFGAGWR